jgi:hypothetical protein
LQQKGYPAEWDLVQQAVWQNGKANAQSQRFTCHIAKPYSLAASVRTLI